MCVKPAVFASQDFKVEVRILLRLSSHGPEGESRESAKAKETNCDKGPGLAARPRDPEENKKKQMKPLTRLKS